MTINGNKIAKNSVFLYARLVINMIIALYSSRVLLHVLGVEDYGVFGVVGGVAAMFASLRSSFASATQRFYNYEIGRGDNQDNIKLLFNTSILIHLLLSVFLVVLLEIVGVWLISNKLTFPDGKIEAAYFVFQGTVITTVLTTMCIPFDAMILARERMDFYAGLSILDSVMKLLCIVLLRYIGEDRLQIYTLSLIGIQFFNLLCVYLYARVNFHECRFDNRIDKRNLISLSQFAGWSFFGNFAFAIGNEVSNFFLNIFGGVVFNASRSIAYQVKNAIMSFLSNGMIALRPQAVQQYASGNNDSFFTMIYFSSKTMFYISILMVTPIFLYTKEILQMWLGEIPYFSDIFIKIIMLQILIRSFHEPIDIIFKSSGNLRNYQLASLVSTLLILPISYVFLKFGYPIYTVFVLMVIMESIELVLIVVLAKKEGLSIIKYIKKVIIPCVVVFIVAFACSIFINHYLFNGIHFLGGIFFTEFICIVSVIVAGYDKKEKNSLIKMIKK